MEDYKDYQLYNYVQRGLPSEDRFDQINGISQNSIRLKDQNIRMNQRGLTPLDINQRWLERFGFKNCTTERQDLGCVSYKDENVLIKIKSTPAEPSHIVEYWAVRHHYNDYIKIEHVHELQNFYSAKVWKNLTIK